MSWTATKPCRPWIGAALSMASSLMAAVRPDLELLGHTTWRKRFCLRTQPCASSSELQIATRLRVGGKLRATYMLPERTHPGRYDSRTYCSNFTFRSQIPHRPLRGGECQDYHSTKPRSRTFFRSRGPPSYSPALGDLAGPTLLEPRSIKLRPAHRLSIGCVSSAQRGSHEKICA